MALVISVLAWDASSPRVALAASAPSSTAVQPEVVQLYARAARERLAVAKEAAGARTRSMVVLYFAGMLAGAAIGAQPGFAMKLSDPNRAAIGILGGSAGILVGGLGVPFVFAELSREPSPLDGKSNLTYPWNHRHVDLLLAMSDTNLFSTVRQRYPGFDAEVIRFYTSGEYGKRLQEQAALERERMQAQKRSATQTVDWGAVAGGALLLGTGAVLAYGAMQDLEGATRGVAPKSGNALVPGVTIGMTMRQVHDLLGPPASHTSTPGYVYWRYNTWAGTKTITFLNGVVVGL